MKASPLGPFAGLLLVFLCVVNAEGAAARRGAAARAVTVSKPSPFRTCPDHQNRVFVNSEVEPSLAIDAARRRVVIAYQQDRFGDAAARGIATSYSRDGGRSWKRSVIPSGFCALRRDTQPFRVSDPWVSIGPDGRAYALASYTATTSGDGGRTWTRAVALQRPTSDFLFDKGSVTANPRRPGMAYAVWARYRRSASGPPDESDAMLSRTTNGGRTWSTPKVILEHGNHSGPIASVIVVDPKRHRLYHLAFWQVGPEPRFDHPSKLVVQWSTDDGASWSAARDIGLGLTVGLADDPSTGRKIRTGVVVPSFAIDRASGALYATWQDARFASRKVDQVVLSSSRDGGKTWTSPVRVSHAGAQAWIPTLAVTPTGAVGVAYFEAPSGRTQQTAPVQYWLAVSQNGGKTFARRRIGAAFSLRRAPLLQGVPELAVPPGLFLGDYMGIDASDGRFHLAFVTANTSNGNRTDVRYAVLPAK